MTPEQRSPAQTEAGGSGTSAVPAKRSQRVSVPSAKKAAGATQSSPESSPSKQTPTQSKSTRGATKLSSTLDKLPSAREISSGGKGASRAGVTDENQLQPPAATEDSFDTSPGASPSSLAHRQKRARHAPQHFDEMHVI